MDVSPWRPSQMQRQRQQQRSTHQRDVVQQSVCPHEGQVVLWAGVRKGFAEGPFSDGMRRTVFQLA